MKNFYLKLLGTAFVLLGSTGVSRAQEEAVIPSEVRTLYSKEATGQIQIHNLGWGLGGSYHKLDIKDRKHIYEGALSFLKHPKEYRTANPFYESARSFYYGKQNVLINVKTGYGRDVQIFDKAFRDGVEIRAVATSGVNWGLLKPVYLLVFRSAGEVYPRPRAEKFDINKHQPQDIYGSAGFAMGLDEISFVPGIYIKGGFQFDWAPEEEMIRALEVGINVDAYPKRVPIMAPITEEVNKQVFISFYARFLLGKKW